MSNRRSIILMLTLVSLAHSGCTLIFDPDGRIDTALLDRTDRAESLWLSKRPVAYVATVKHLCYCGWEAIGPVRLEASRRQGSTEPAFDERVVSRTYTFNDQPVPEDFHDLFPVIQDLFDRIRVAVASHAHEVSVDFHPLLGYPTRIFIDMRENVSDDEVTYVVEDLIAS